MKMMKHYTYRTILRNRICLTIIIAFITLFSCKDQDYMFKEYVVEGGIPYLGSVMSLKARIGINRVEVGFSVVDLSTTKVGIYWNDYSDSIMIDIGQERSIKKIINLPEGDYSLYVKSFDKKGNSSNPVELITRSVGENYLAVLTHRNIKSKVTGFNNDLTIQWEIADPYNGARFTDLIYTNIENEEVTLKVENGTSSTSIKDYKPGTRFKRVTYYSPDNEWLDTIIPPVIPESSLMIDKKLGKVITYSSQQGSNTAANYYNGNNTDMWLTSGNYPQFATIDLGRVVPVSGFNVWPSFQQTNGRADPRAPTRIKFEVSLNNVEWITLAEYPYDNSLYYFTREFSVPVTDARYVRFTGVECTQSPVFSASIGGPGNKVMNLAELDVLFYLNE